MEIGSERGDGSSAFFMDYARKHEVPFYTVDPNKEIYMNLVPITNAFHMTGEEFLERVLPIRNQTVSIAYLDGFDWIWEGSEEENYIIGQKNEYKSRGVVMNNENCQMSHLTQARLLDNYMIKGGYVLFDDTWPDGALYDGKGGTAVPWLKKNKYEVVEESKTSYVLLRKL